MANEQFFHDGAMQLTYNDLAIIPQYSEIDSRWDVDVRPDDNTGLQLPVIVANMTAVSGKRMAETVARRGAVAVLPQDFSDEEMVKRIERIKHAHPIYETPVKLRPNQTVNDARELIFKRSHGAVLVTSPDGSEPLGLVTYKDLTEEHDTTLLQNVMRKDIDHIPEGMTPEEMLQWFAEHRHKYAPVLSSEGILRGVMTEKGAFRSCVYPPAVDVAGRLLVAAAIGINGNPAQRAALLRQAGADILVIDTAHGDQKKMLQAITAVREKVGDSTTIVAGNVVTSQGTINLLNAGADIVKVGVGPGAMCTTRVQTGVGRPQASAVMDCVATALEHDGYVWADGGVKYPMDVAKAIALGASGVMIGSMFAPTNESAAEMLTTVDGKRYKSNHGMASGKAVLDRNAHTTGLERMKRAYFQEGISSSMLRIDPERPGAEDVIDIIAAGLRSAMTYSGASTIEAFSDRSHIAIQTASGYQEGHPVPNGW